jgi:hypothetical protein
MTNIKIFFEYERLKIENMLKAGKLGKGTRQITQGMISGLTLTPVEK